MTAELSYLSISDAAAALRARKFSAEELTRHMLARIARLEPRLHAYQYLAGDAALAQAAAADRAFAEGRDLGPLQGIPIALKDLCFTADMPTGAGMTIHRDFRPAHDASVVSRLRAAGAVLLGKLKMTEGAYADHHPLVTPPVNPWHPDYFVGSSSSGSGVATAAGLCFASLGSDTGGSIRFPSSANALSGLKPTWGRVSRHGIFPLAETLDHIGPMARSAQDAAIMLQAIAGADPADPTAALEPVPDYGRAIAGGVAGVRLGIDERLLALCEAEVAAAAAEAIATFRRLGADIVALACPDLEAITARWTAACGVETALAHEATYPARAADYGPALAGLIELGRRTSAADYARIQIERAYFSGRLRALFATIDLLLLPAQPLSPLTLQRRVEMRRTPEGSARLQLFTAPFDMSGSPTLTFPAGFTDHGLPIGLQVIGRHFDEATLLRAGHAFQSASDWHLRRPPV